MDTLLRVRGLAKGFGRRRMAVLRDLDLHLRPGDIVGIEGTNGSGKSTLFKLIAGVLRADGGELSRGVPIVPILSLIALPYHDLSLVENLKLLHLLYGARTPLTTDDARARLAEEGLGAGLADRRAAKISPGMAAKMFRAALRDAPRAVFLLDEVLEHLDPQSGAQWEDWIRGRAATGSAVVMISHSAARLRELCTTVWRMENGRLTSSTP